MVSDNVVGINGGLPTSVPKVSQSVVEALDEYLEMAKAGEIVAFVGAAQHFDGLGSYRVVGHFGQYSVLGSLRRAEHDLHLVMDEVE